MILHILFISNSFISKDRLKLAKNQANTKQHLEAVLLLFENYLYSSFILSSKNNRTYCILKSKQKNKCFCIHEIIRLIIMKMKMKMKNRSHRHDINRPRPRHGHNSKYRKCLSMMY